MQFPFSPYHPFAASSSQEPRDTTVLGDVCRRLNGFQGNIRLSKVSSTCASKDDAHNAWLDQNPLPSRNGTIGQLAWHDNDPWADIDVFPDIHYPTFAKGTGHIESRTKFKADACVDVIRKYGKEFGLDWDHNRKRWIGFDEHLQRQFEIVLPRTLEWPTKPTSWQFFASSFQETGLQAQLLVMLSADSAALGLFEDGLLTKHKVLTGYTIRKKQGKAQLTHLRSKSGGRSGTVGGSIRSRETRRLFQSVATKIAEWEPHIQSHCHVLFWTGGVRVWNEVYASRDPPMCIDRRDGRWEKAAVSVKRPRFDHLNQVYEILSAGEIMEVVFDEAGGKVQ